MLKSITGVFSRCIGYNTAAQKHEEEPRHSEISYPIIPLQRNMVTVRHFESDPISLQLNMVKLRQFDISDPKQLNMLAEDISSLEEYYEMHQVRNTPLHPALSLPEYESKGQQHEEIKETSTTAGYSSVVLGVIPDANHPLDLDSDSE